MKPLLVGTALLLLSNAPAEKDVGYNQLQKRASEILPALLKDPAIAPRYETCKEHQLKPKFDMGQCLWEGTDGAGKQVLPPLSKGEREKIQKLIDGTAGADVTTTRIGDHPALKKLEQYYLKRLKKIIDPKDEKILADHTVFYKIHRSQLGKNVISALSSYCLDADGGNQYLIEQEEDKREKIRKGNLKKLEIEKEVPGQEKATSQGFQHWGRCAQQVKNICQNTCPQNETIKKYCCEENPCEQDELFEYSQRRACEVVDYIQAARQNLLALDQIDEGWKKRVDQGFAGDIVTKVNIEEITNLTSKEIVEKSGYAQEQQKILQEMKDCVEKFDPKKCQKFVGDRKEEGSTLLDEYSLRTRIIQQKIDDMKTAENKEDSLERYLKEEGYSKEEIAKMLDDDMNVEKLQEQIARRFKEKRAALQRSLKNKLEQTQVSKEQGEDAQKSNMTALWSQAKKEQQRLGELVFFTNMISGFLEIGDEEGNILGTNSEALQQELKDSIFSASKDDSSPSPYNFEALEKMGSQNGVSTQKNTQESRNLDVGTINQKLLQYP